MPITINGSGTVTGISAGGLPDSCITTDDIAANAVTYAKIGTTEQGQLCKAWVNFNGTANTNLSGTYSQSGTTVTVTATAHGLVAGNTVYSDITTGTAVDGTYTVATVTDANTFTYTAGTSLTTSGNVTLIRNTIRASYNVSSITDNGVGDYTVNFTTAMVDANYVVTGVVSNTSNAWASRIGELSRGQSGLQQFGATAPTTSSCRIETLFGASSGADGGVVDFSAVHVSIFR